MAAVCGIALVAGLAHGLSGFGFPLISTPMVALFADVRTAVVVTLLPNIVVNLLSAFSGAGWRETLRRYWLIPVYVLVGTVIGTQVVLWAPANPLRLLLAAVIVAYLQQDRFRRIDWSVIVRHPNGSGLAFGLVAGFFSGTVNVMLPPLLIYFSTLGLAPLVMTQVMNACFLVGKVSQAAVFAARGQFSLDGLALTIPVCAVALAGYMAGKRLQSRVSPATYRKMMRAVLWAMAALLAGQAAGVIGAR
jgi:uncharacterized protein